LTIYVPKTVFSDLASGHLTFAIMKHLLPLLLLSSLSAQAQQLLHCGADEMRIRTLKENPKIAKAVVERDAELERFTGEFRTSDNQRGGGPYIIPVVFHVIHKYGNENISREQMLDGLRILNETFRKTREDTADIHADFKPIHADCEIEFHLATKDPEGNCHSGINRIASDLTNSGDHRVKELIHWDPSMYLNVYIVSNAASLAGHCVWPADADTIPQWDGIVIAHSYVGTIGTSSLTQSVAFAHECGHYLNLHHIWGGNNVPNFYYLPVGQQSNCGGTDMVDDTPTTIGWSSCNLNANSCGNVRDNVQNAMDYTYCNIMFTEGQKERMHACLNSPIANRNNLWTPENLLATGVLPEPGPLCEADFVANNTLICNPSGEAVTFTNTSYHGEVDSVYWEFPGGDTPFSVMASPTVVYDQPGMYDVSLTVHANGQSEQVTKENHIHVLPDSSWSTPFWDWFEGAPSFNGPKWFSNSLDQQNEWQLTDVAAHSGAWSAMVDNWEDATMTVDELYGPAFDLSDATVMKIAFKYAFAQQSEETNGSKLLLQISRNCETNWTTRLSLAGNALQTADAQQEPFIPGADHWQQDAVNIPATHLVDGFRFRFVFTSSGNDRLFLDDVNVDLEAGISELETRIVGLNVLPNPTEGQVFIHFEIKRAMKLNMKVVDAFGRTVHSSNSKNYGIGAFSEQLDLGFLCAGLFILKVESETDHLTRSFIIF
jgi:PKD repeat protein